MCFSMIVLLSCSPIFVLTTGMLFIFLFILYFLFLFCQLRPNTMCYWLFASFFLPFCYCSSILAMPYQQLCSIPGVFDYPLLFPVPSDYFFRFSLLQDKHCHAQIPVVSVSRPAHKY